jgi:hypothetical protein
MNRLIYDTCAYSKSLSESMAPLSYIMDASRFEREDKCRPQLGTVGGTAVSHVQGNMVDLENNLFGLDRPNTLCPEYKFDPRLPVQGREYVKPVQHPEVDVELRHLRPCQLHDVAPVPGPPAPLPRPACKAAPAPPAPAPCGGTSASSAAAW